MPNVKLKTDLPDDVAQELRTVLSYFGAPHVANKIWEVLTPEEQKSLGQNNTSTQLIQCRAQGQGCSFERALLDIAHEASVIDSGRHLRLRRGIGEPVDGTDKGPRPVWDKANRKLYYRGRLLRDVAASAKNILAILSAFEEEGWPARVNNPLTGGAKSKPLRDAIAKLNGGLMGVEVGNLAGIKFFADGEAKGVRWHEV